MSTAFLQVIPQRHKMDCAVACLAMLIGLSYEDVLMAFHHNVMARGASIRQVVEASKRLKRPLRFTRKCDLETATGILAVRSSKWPHDHLVVLKDEIVVDTDATIWEVDVFLSAYEARPLSLLHLVEAA